MEDVKIKLSALWVAGMLTGLVGGMLELVDPGKLAEIMTGEVEGMKITSELLLGMAILFVIPPVMVFLSLTLKDSPNRWANIILGIVFAGFGLFDLTAYLDKPYYMLLGIFSIVFSILIVWYAWKWPKEGV